MNSRQNKERFTKVGVYTHEHRIRDDGLGLGRSGGGVVVIRIV